MVKSEKHPLHDTVQPIISSHPPSISSSVIYKALIVFYSLLWLAPVRFAYAWGAEKDYKENLSHHRILFEAIPLDIPDNRIKPIKSKPTLPSTTHDIAASLHELLHDLKMYYQEIPTLSGYTVQAYMGTNRQLAFQATSRLLEAQPALKPVMQYKQPNFTVHIGVFLERLEAYPLYFSVQNIFAQATIRPDQFPNRPGIFAPLPIIQSIDTLALPSPPQPPEENQHTTTNNPTQSPSQDP